MENKTKERHTTLKQIIIMIITIIIIIIIIINNNNNNNNNKTIRMQKTVLILKFKCLIRKLLVKKLYFELEIDGLIEMTKELMLFNQRTLFCH